MTRFTCLALAAGAALTGAVWATTPAAAQGWHGDGYYGWGDRGWRDESWRRRHYGSYGYNVDAGEMDIAICPQGYHLGPSARLCWPD
jgi:hypothetical protein